MLWSYNVVYLIMMECFYCFLHFKANDVDGNGILWMSKLNEEWILKVEMRWFGSFEKNGGCSGQRLLDGLHNQTHDDQHTNMD